MSAAALGVVVHPTRPIDEPIDALKEWARQHDAELVQVAGTEHDREVAPAGDAGDRDLIVSIGGDGTMLAAIRATIGTEVPVLGVACGSLGVLTRVNAADLPDALDRFAADDWSPQKLPALCIARDGESDLLAINDVAVVRGGVGQLRTRVSLDGVLYSRIAGDGYAVSTQIGSSAYTIAAGGPMLAPGLDAFVLTPLATHGGFSPPLVIAGDRTLELDVAAGFGGSRLELDGQVVGNHSGTLTITLRSEVATVVRLDGDERYFAGLRRRGVLLDSPRIVAEDARE